LLQFDDGNKYLKHPIKGLRMHQSKKTSFVFRAEMLFDISIIVLTRAEKPCAYLVIKVRMENER